MPINLFIFIILIIDIIIPKLHFFHFYKLSYLEPFFHLLCKKIFYYTHFFFAYITYFDISFSCDIYVYQVVNYQTGCTNHCNFIMNVYLNKNVLFYGHELFLVDFELNHNLFDNSILNIYLNESDQIDYNNINLCDKVI